MIGETLFTVTAIIVEEEHPAVEVPIIENMVDTAGETVTDVPVKLPGIQLYVLAPEAVSTVDCPVQILDGAALAKDTGIGFTVTTTLSVAVEAQKSVTVTT